MKNSHIVTKHVCAFINTLASGLGMAGLYGLLTSNTLIALNSTLVVVGVFTMLICMIVNIFIELDSNDPG
jgi:FtsH-binding integral membrane protein